MLGFFKKIFKRQIDTSDLYEDRSFVPVTNTKDGYYSGAYSPVVARCIALYSNLLNCTPLKCDNENHPLLKLLNRRPYPPLSRANFWELLVENYFLFQGFFCVNRKQTHSGEVTALCPFTHRGVFTFTQSGFNRKESPRAKALAGEFTDSVGILQKWIIMLGIGTAKNWNSRPVCLYKIRKLFDRQLL